MTNPSASQSDCELRTACPPAAERGRTAGAQSPHVVIRGETLSPLESISKPAQVAHNDWLAFTLTPPLEAAKTPVQWLLPHLRETFGLPDFSAQSKGNGWNGYSNRVDLGENSHYGLIAHGGEKQRGTVHVELNACVCGLVPDWEKVQHWGESLGAKITRVDLAHDDFEGRTVTIERAKLWYLEGGFTNSGRPPKAKLYDDMDSGEGKTLYIGNRANGKLCRVYEKGKQLGDRLSSWVRVEVELRGKKRVIPWDVLTSPAKYLAGAFPCLGYLSDEQHKIRTTTKAVEITIESMTRYLRTAGGKSFNVLRQVYAGDDTALLNAITRDGIPRRLANYSDFLPRYVDSMEVLP